MRRSKINGAVHGLHMTWENFNLARGEINQAQKLLKTSLAHFRQLGIQFGYYRALISIAHLRRSQCNWADAKILYRKALDIQQDTHYIQYIAQIMQGMAHISNAENFPEIAVKLFASSQAQHDSIEMQRWSFQEVEF